MNMEFTYEVFKHGKGYGYKILRDGIPFIIQDFEPNVEGFVPMTKEKAEQYARELVEYFENLARSQQTNNQ